MKKLYITYILSMLLCVGMILTGCSSNENTEEEAPAVETIQVIGDSSDPLEVDMTNELGDIITGLSVKTPAMLIFPDNIMTADQSIKDKETVNFYCDPDNASNEDVNVKPTQDYMGYWNQSGSTDEELTIWDISDNEVTFYLWWYHDGETETTTVTLDEDNVGTFSSMTDPDHKVEGEVSFTDTSVKITIDYCNDDIIDIGDGVYIFDEKHPESWAWDEDYSFKQEEDEQGASDTLQVTMTDNTVYELSDFAVDDMKDVALCYEDDVAYLEYTKPSTDEAVNTKEQEQTIKQDKEAAQPVIDQIAKIGEVTEDSEAEITAAREAYDALTDAQKTYVYNEPYLMWKEVTFIELPGEASRISDDEDEEEYDGEDDEEYAEGDNYSWGYQLGISGMTEEEAAAEWDKHGISDTDSKYYQQYYNDFWDGFWAGYGDYSPGGNGVSRGDRNRMIANGGADPWEDDDGDYEEYDDEDWDDEAIDWD